MPLSPHLQIYKLPLVSLLSVTHRFTGIILFVFLLIWLSFNSAFAFDSYSFSFFTIFQSSCYLFDSASKFILIYFFCLLLFFFSFAFHLLNGIRHLLWDLNLFLSLRAVHITNVLLLVFTPLLTLFFIEIFFLQSCNFGFVFDFFYLLMSLLSIL